MKPNEKKAIEFLEKLSSHSTYYPAPMVEHLKECGLSAEMMIKENGIIVEGIRIESITPEWGKPGIDSLHLLSAIYQILINEPARSDMQGRGFWYDHVLSQLKDRIIKIKPD